MKLIVSGLMVLGLTAALMVVDTQAQGPRWRGGGGWGAGGPYGSLYDAKTIETLSGEVTQVEEITPQRGMGKGVHLTLRTEAETVSVHLGPLWYIERQDIQIAAGDKLRVTGSRIVHGGKPAIIAAEIHKGDDVLKLRDSEGIPMWAGWRRSR